MNVAAKSRVFFITFCSLCVLGALIGAVVFITHPTKTGALSEGFTIDRIVVNKSTRTLSVFRHGSEIKTYRVALGRQPVGPKEQEGDMRTPEGLYTIDYRNRQSDYHLALHISYPGPEDISRAAARGVSPGCDIMIHGLPNGQGWLGTLHRQKDWTAGCIALTDEEIEELWRITPDGTPIEIRP
jgi:murein L,D-transpeptidase YafK